MDDKGTVFTIIIVIKMLINSQYHEKRLTGSSRTVIPWGRAFIPRAYTSPYVGAIL